MSTPLCFTCGKFQTWGFKLVDERIRSWCSYKCFSKSMVQEHPTAPLKIWSGVEDFHDDIRLHNKINSASK